MLLSTQKIAWLLWISKINDDLVLKSSQHFHRGRNYMTLGYKTTEPSSFWAQWTVVEYEEMDETGKVFVELFPSVLLLGK